MLNSLLRKKNIVLLFSVLLQLIALAMVLVHIRVGGKTAYSDRYLSLISMILLLIHSIYVLVLMFINKNTLKIVLYSIVTILSIGIIYKYTTDYPRYYADNHFTTMLYLGLLFLHLMISTWPDDLSKVLKQNPFILFIPVFSILFLILLYTNYTDPKPTLFHNYAFLYTLFIGLIVLWRYIFSNLFKFGMVLTVAGLSLLLLLGITSITLISNGGYTSINTDFLIAISSLVLVTSYLIRTIAMSDNTRLNTVKNCILMLLFVVPTLVFSSISESFRERHLWRLLIILIVSLSTYIRIFSKKIDRTNMIVYGSSFVVIMILMLLSFIIYQDYASILAFNIYYSIVALINVAALISVIIRQKHLKI